MTQNSHNNSTKLLNKTFNKLHLTPGVGDYDLLTTDLRKRSPICTIGNSARF